MDTQPRSPLVESSYLRSLIAGGLAGTAVDTLLFPLDTLKTRAQSSTGFLASGGFRGVYSGLGSAVVGSAPGAALFFVAYDGVKRYLTPPRPASPSPGSNRSREAVAHAVAASVGEVAACAVRVPTEVVKTRTQAGQHSSSIAALRSILDVRHAKGWARMGRELYRGWGITVMREVPFTVIQFPLWEALKTWWVGGRGGNATAVESAVFGSLSGAVAAGLTTPLDVLKTRLMLASKGERTVGMARRIYGEEGARVFFRGIGPRTTWIGIGGAIFLGTYQFGSNMLGGQS